MAFGTVAAAGVSGSGSRAAVLPAATRDSPCPSTHERRAVGPADLEADVGRIVEVAHVFRDRERPYRRVDVMAQADRDSRWPYASPAHGIDRRDALGQSHERFRIQIGLGESGDQISRRSIDLFLR